MSTSSDNLTLLDQLAEDFVGRLRRGERPPVQSYTEQHPLLASEIRRLFPTLATVEKLGASTDFTLAEAPPDLPERIGDYRILRKLGEGGMGVVYEAIQESLARHVALKVLPSYAQRSDRYRERFRIEARAAARLHHPHIVPVFGVGQDGGQHYYAMQFISGRGLDEILQASAGKPVVGAETVTLASPAPTTLISVPAPIPADIHPVAPRDHGHTRSMARIIAQVADALAYAHSEGVIHRDIKPSNLILDKHGCIWITDFGLAKTTEADGLTEPGDIIGTIRYMAPERFSGWSDARSDVYSLGATLFELLTRRPMRDEADRGKLIRNILHTDPPSPRKFNRSIPPDLETIVQKATAREPGHRYPSAQAVADELKRFLEGRPIQARRQTWARYGWSWCRRKPFVAGMIGTVAALLLVLLTGSLVVNVWLDDQNSQIVDQNRQIGSAQDALSNQLFEIDSARSREAQAHQDARRQLMRALRREAQAARWSRRPGSRGEALEAVRQLMELAKEMPLSADETLEVRNLVIAASAQMDVVPEPVTQLATTRSTWFSPDLQHYVVVKESRLTVCAYPSGREISSIQVNGLNSQLFSPDGKHLVFGCSRSDGGPGPAYVVWDWQADKIVAEIPGAFGAASWAINHDGSELALAYSDGTLDLHSLPDGREMRRLSIRPGVRGIQYSPTSQQIALHRHSAELEIWNLADGKLLRTFLTPGRTGIQSIGWSADGRMIAVGCNNYRAYVWHTENGQLASDLIGHQAEVTRILFDPNGEWIATGSWEGMARFWNPVTGSPILNFRGEVIAVSADGRRLVHQQGHQTRILQVHGLTELRSLHGHLGGKSPWHVSFGCADRVLASSGLDGVRLWDTATGHQVGVLNPAGGALATLFQPRGDYLLSAGRHHFSRWSIEYDNGEHLLRIKPEEPLLLHQADSVMRTERRVTSSLDGQRIAISNQSRKSIYVFASDEPNLWRSIAAMPELNTVLLSPDGQWVLGASWPTASAKIWNAISLELAVDLAPPHPSYFGFRPDGRHFAVGNERGGYVLEVGTWKRVSDIPPDKSGPSISCLTYSPDSRILAVVRSGHELQLLDATTLSEIARLEAPDPQGVAHLAFSADGGQLAAASTTHVVQLWDLRSIRSRLRELSLDWEQSQYARPAESKGVLRVRHEPSKN